MRSVPLHAGVAAIALALSVADRLLMLEHSVYTVAAPEAAASILWRDKSYASAAADAMRISARELLGMNIIDEIVPEPVGGAHHNHCLAAGYLKEALLKHLDELERSAVDKLLEKRYQKYRAIGSFVRVEAPVAS